MSQIFSEIKPTELKENVFKQIGTDWMLVAAGGLESYNVMTASWGAQGVLWDKDICICFIRPTRFTYQFLEKSDYFTLSFFEEKYRDLLNYCGSNSGRDTNKMSIKGLTPKKTELGNVCFEESRLCIECRNIYFDDINPKNFLVPGIEKNYPKKDYHRIYIGEIMKCFKKA